MNPDVNSTRRALLRSLAMLGGLGLAGCKVPVPFEQGVNNACADQLPAGLTDLPWVRQALDGVRMDQVWDCHCHLLGNGRSGSGIYVDPAFDAGEGLRNKVQRTMFANGACLGTDAARWDVRMVERLVHVAGQMPVGYKAMVMAFDFAWDEQGRQRPEWTTFSVPNSHAARVAAAHPERMEWIASVHPMRPDALEELERCKAQGARAVKWLPPSMGIDLTHARCVPFYRKLRELNLPLLVHVGEEQAVRGAHRQEFGHPLALRHPLGEGVRVIAAHCASLGESPDTDRPGAPVTPNFELFARLMEDPRHAPLLHGDISATILFNRGDLFAELIRRKHWHGRLLHGSDYPLPGILPLISLDYFVRQGMLDAETVPVLRSLREANPLMFEFLFKRILNVGGQSLPARVFETRAFFERTA